MVRAFSAAPVGDGYMGLRPMLVWSRAFGAVETQQQFFYF